MGPGTRLLQSRPVLLSPRPLAVKGGPGDIGGSTGGPEESESELNRRAGFTACCGQGCPPYISPRKPALHYVERGTLGSISRLQRSIPPAMLVPFSMPCS